MGFVWGNITYVITAITLHSTPIPQNASSLISYIFSHLSDTRGPVGIDVRVDFTLYFRHSTIAVSCHLNTCLDTFNGVNTLHLTSFQESFGLTWMTWHAFELLLLHLQYRQRVAASQFLANAIFSCADTRTSSPCQLHFVLIIEFSPTLCLRTIHYFLALLTYCLRRLVYSFLPFTLNFCSSCIFCEVVTISIRPHTSYRSGDIFHILIATQLTSDLSWRHGRGEARPICWYTLTNVCYQQQQQQQYYNN